MRDRDEIQRAHDILVAVLLGEVPVSLGRKAELGTRAAVDVLCWALRHDHNLAFGRNLAKIERAAEAAGFRLRKAE